VIAAGMAGQSAIHWSSRTRVGLPRPAAAADPLNAAEP